MPHGRSTSCYARSTPSVYTTCLACVRLADHTSRARAARRIRAHRRTVSTRSLRQRKRSTESGHGSEATGTSAATDTASRRRAHIRTRRPGAGGRGHRAADAASGVRGVLGPAAPGVTGEGSGSGSGRRIRRAEVPRALLPHIHERIESRVS